MSSQQEPYRTTVFNVTRRRRPRGPAYRLIALAAPLYLIPVFLIIVLAFCLLLAPLLYLIISAVIIRSAWGGSTEDDYWVDESCERERFGHN
jgi:hypothetical protein